MIYKVGIGGNNAWDGLTWATRKATFNGAEDIPVVPGDWVDVGPGVYRELWTIDVDGAAGLPITFNGDYSGRRTDGIGGVVRITGSNNDQTATRAQCINLINKDYRTFVGFQFDTTTNYEVLLQDAQHIIMDKCIFMAHTASVTLYILGAPQLDIHVSNCAFLFGCGYQPSILITDVAAVDNSAHVVENCIFMGFQGIRINAVGGILIRNNTFISPGAAAAIYVGVALTAGQFETVNNNIFQGCVNGVLAINLGEIIEDYNDFYAVQAPRTNVAVGANSVAYPALFDTRWFFESLKFC